MATILASAILNKAAVLLQDTLDANIRWPLTELLGWLNDGQRDIVLQKPNAYTKNAVLTLVGGTKQALPSDGITLIDVVRNMGTSGAEPGRGVRIAMREILDAQTPDWHASTTSSRVVHYMYSRLDPKNFYVFPPQPSAPCGSVEIIYSAAPADATLVSVITVDDIYAPALLDYVLYRAYSKDAEYTQDQNRAATHFQAYAFSVTGKAKGEDGTNPNSSAPANPNITPTR